MDPHLLRTFMTVVDEGSFSAAADRLGYTQPAVSQQIAALEADLGTPLLLRRPVRPTRAGERLLEHAGPLLLRLRAARADVARVSAEAGAVTVAASPLAITARTAAALAGMAVLRTVDRATAVTQVASGEADLALVDGPAAPTDPLALPDVGPLTAVGVGEEDLVVVLPEGHPLARRTGLRLDELADALWIDAPGVLPLDRLRSAARIDGLRTAIVYEGHDVATLAYLALAGHGLALLPVSATRRIALPLTGTQNGPLAVPQNEPQDGVSTGQQNGPLTVPLIWPRIVHRTELLHATLPKGPAQRIAEALGSWNSPATSR
jgi:DNA-binding transcriptional LysR family regulator